MKHSTFTSKLGYLLFIFTLFTISYAPSSYGATLFTDDFESGNLDNWVIGGRQLGTNIANVVPCGTGSLGGHLFHSSFTEITLHRDFQFDPSGAFYFDLEVDVSSTTPLLQITMAAQELTSAF